VVACLQMGRQCNLDCNLCTAQAPVLTLCWSPNGTKIACGNKDGTAIVWNVADAQSAISASECKPACDEITHARTHPSY
jgi:WD40 repeat protein